MPKADLNSSDDVLLGKYNRYTFLYTKTGKTSAENTELAGLQTELSNYLFTASDFNNIAGIPYAAATGTANTYVVTLSPAPTSYTDGMPVSTKINVDATAASTLNVNGLGVKPLKKSNGLDVTNLKANGVYTFRYNATTGNFILQGEGGSGNAVAGDLLLNKTATTDAGDIVGSMPDNGAKTYTPGAASVPIDNGKHTGSQVAAVAGLAANVIKQTATVGGVAGTFTSDATVTAADVLNSKVAYGVNGARLVGNAVAGKPYATGTLTSSAGTTAYVDENGTNQNYFDAIATGLNFPGGIQTIVLIDTGANPGFRTVFSDNFTAFTKIVAAGAHTGLNAIDFKLLSPASVTTTGFRLPCGVGNDTFTYEVYGK